jgi:hypothetical protein
MSECMKDYGDEDPFTGCETVEDFVAALATDDHGDGRGGQAGRRRAVRTDQWSEAAPDRSRPRPYPSRIRRNQAPRLDPRHARRDRPAAGRRHEVVEAWRVLMPLRHEPVALVLSRQPLPTLNRSRYALASGLARGAYVLGDPPTVSRR